MNSSAALEKGLIKVSVMYPYAEGKTFDMEYYETKHMPMVAGFLGSNLVKYTIEKGFASGIPNTPLPFMAIGIFYVKDLGDYQAANIKTVLAAREVLISTGMADLPLDVTLNALSKVKKLTGLRGRWDVLQNEPLIIADVAHNPAGLTGAMKQWNNVDAKTKHIITGFVKDKDIQGALALYPKDCVYYFCNADIPRALPAAKLQEAAAEHGLTGQAYSSVAEAVKAAKDAIGKDDALLITGSVFIVGEAIAYLNVNNGLLFPIALV